MLLEMDTHIHFAVNLILNCGQKEAAAAAVPMVNANNRKFAWLKMEKIVVAEFIK